MQLESLLLVLISGLGVFHGLIIGLFLLNYKKGHTLANKLLALLLFVLSFRVGKSVILEFTPDTDVKVIFLGLAFMFTIGPIYFLLSQTLLAEGFKLKPKHAWHLIPFAIGLVWAGWIEEIHLKELPIVLFICCFMAYYFHFLIYLFYARWLQRKKGTGLSAEPKRLLTLLFYGLLSVWIVYFLNLIDEVVPYIIGPILYSVIAYTLTYIIIKEGLIPKLAQSKYDTTSLSQEQIDTLFGAISAYIIDEQNFKNPDITLNDLATHLKHSKQSISMVVNVKSKMNFNQFINTQRVAEAKVLLADHAYDHRTIASIALDVGFNSISSFNTAFKKIVGTTPKTFKAQHTK